MSQQTLLQKPDQQLYTAPPTFLRQTNVSCTILLFNQRNPPTLPVRRSSHVKPSTYVQRAESNVACGLGISLHAQCFCSQNIVA